jgi:H+/Cl- antiporter ClcA
MTKKYNLLFDINYLFKWLVICVLLSIIIGTVTAFFLHSLEHVTALRLKYTWLIFTLPIIGGITGWIYNKWGTGSIKGNNLLLEEHKKPEQSIPFKMAPMILFTTIISHVSGASVGREGTAVQMGGAISDQFTKWFSLNNDERKTIIIVGISAGFSAVFGTPFAGALFALEIMGFKNIRWQSIFPSFIAAFAAHFICLWWNVSHVDYHFDVNWIWNLKNVLLIIASGVFFGITAMLFSNANKLFKPLTVAIPTPWIKGVVGGAFILILYLCFPMTDYMGLGISGISNAFSQITPWYVFLIKLLLTVFTLSVGFKGGEVTPLFFIGATMSSFLILFIPLPLAILAAMGLVAVFAGATHTVIASIALGFELFGATVGTIVALAVIMAYFTSGEHGIYASQDKTGAKYTLYNYIKEIIKL